MVCPRLALAFAQEGRLVGLHRPVEVVELRVLAEGGGIDLRRFGVGFGADDLGALLALGIGSTAPPAARAVRIRS